MRKWLKDLREMNNMSQQNVADKIGITQNYYSMIEQNERMPKMTIEMAQKLSEIFSIPIKTILENEQQYNNKMR